MTAAATSLTTLDSPGAIPDIEPVLPPAHVGPLPRCEGIKTQVFVLSIEHRKRLSPNSKYAEARRVRFQCKADAVYRVGDTLFCNAHFNRYFETHDVDLDSIIRLSDKEEDFHANSHGRRKKNRKKYRLKLAERQRQMKEKNKDK